MLCAVACALPGNFLVLRRMSMMGDAISHAVLPGLAVAFLITQSRASLTMFVGAAIVGVLTALFTQWVHSFGKVDRGASMGVVFTTLFAVGLIMIVRAADHVDLDPGCVLYGSIELAPLDIAATITLPVLGETDIPRAAIVLGAVLALNLAVVVLFFKELKISSFDPALATTQGVNATFMHYLLMTLVAVTTVASFETIGSILVIAMLIVPPAAARLLTDRLGVMIALSMVIAAGSAALGHVAAITAPQGISTALNAAVGMVNPALTRFGIDPLTMRFEFTDTTTAGMMASTVGAAFAVILMVAPRQGVISRFAHRAALSFRILCEDVLGLIYRIEEEKLTAAPAMMTQALGASRLSVALATARLRRRGRLTREVNCYRLTDLGRQEARHLIRSHRLWESYLHLHLNLPTDHVHASATKLEHVTDTAMIDRLATRVDRPSHDPHGKVIPDEQGRTPQ
jgi:manganese/zinc/iron transport system permease protein